MSRLDFCTIYVMARVQDDGLAPPVKIGIARNPYTRIQSIQTATPFPITLACVVTAPSRKAAIATEAYMHKLFKKEHLHGEWFQVDILDVAVHLCRHMAEMWEAIATKGFSEEQKSELLEAVGVTELMKLCIDNHNERVSQ